MANTTSPADGLLRALQYGDSQFPSGGFAFSGGLETLIADSRIDSEALVSDFVLAQLAHRWAPGDRVALVHAFRRAHDLDRVVDVDRDYHALCLVESLREGSRKHGRALLGMHVRLGTPAVVEYQRLIADGRTPGHLPVVQGVVWKNAGLSESEAEVAAAHGFSMGLLSAAVRLGSLGHIRAQRIRALVSEAASGILREEVADDAPLAGFSPASDVAAMRHDRAHVRLFAN